MFRAFVYGCIVFLISACKITPHAPRATAPATVTIQDLVIPNPNGVVTNFLALFKQMPDHKALAVAVTPLSTGDAIAGDYAVGFAQGAAGLVQAATAALQSCAENRTARLIAAPCELLRIDDREFELGVTFRRRLHMDDTSRPTLLWRITHQGATVYLGGSLHVLRPTMLPLPPAFDRAYAASSDLVLEVDIAGTSATQIAALVAKYGTLPNGQTLAQLLPIDVQNRLQQRSVQLGVPWTNLERLTPNQIVLIFNTLALTSSGFDPSAGIDASYARRAHAEGKPVIGIETMESQIKLLYAAPLSAVTEYTRTAIDDHVMQLLSQQLMTAWFLADEATVLRMLNFPGSAPETAAWNEQLIENRNVGMAAKVIALLNSNRETHFVLVGAGHIPGSRGVIALLRKAGFNPVQLNRAGDPLVASANTTSAERSHQSSVVGGTGVTTEVSSTH